jgi:hypothetical protein
MCSNYPCKNYIECGNIVGCCQGLVSFYKDNNNNFTTEYLDENGKYSDQEYCVYCAIKHKEEMSGVTETPTDELRDAFQHSIVNEFLFSGIKDKNFNEYLKKELLQFEKTITNIYNFKSTKWNNKEQIFEPY